MYRYLPIRRIYAREVLDSRSNPTVEVEVTVGEGIMGVMDIQEEPLCRREHLPANTRLWNCGT